MPIDSLYNIELGGRYTTDGTDAWIVDAIRPLPSLTLRQIGSTGATSDAPEPSVDASLDAAGFARFHPLEGGALRLIAPSVGRVPGRYNLVKSISFGFSLVAIRAAGAVATRMPCRQHRAGGRDWHLHLRIVSVLYWVFRFPQSRGGGGKNLNNKR